MSRPTDLDAMAKHWADALASWAIPQELLDAAARDPWVLPVSRFAHRADRALRAPAGVSFERAAEVLAGAPGSVLDVGAGAGAASLPLGPLTTYITAVDPNVAMLEAFSERAREQGLDGRTLIGRWPDVAEILEPHDLTVVHHVVYNVADIVPFLLALDAATVRRVVLELPTHHPLTWMSPLWQHFHGLDRPTSPTADDLVEILGSLLGSHGVADLHAEHWQFRDTEQGTAGVDGSGHSVAVRAAIVAQRLCLPESREGEVAHVLQQTPDDPHRDLVTISWTPSARSPRSGSHHRR